jgi:membrane protein implicated in regulation of membrane protease activity
MPKPQLKPPRPVSKDDGTDPLLGVIAFGGLCYLLFIFVNSFHIHGWKSFCLALPLAVLVTALVRLALRRIKEATDLERRTHNGPRMGTRAQRRERARHQK